MEDDDVVTGRPSRGVAALQDLAGAAAFGALASSVVFDAQSQRGGDQFVYARGGYALVCIGVVAGIVAAVLAAVIVARRTRGSEGYRTGVRLILVADAVLVWFALSWFLRQDDPLVPVPAWVLAVSGVAVLVLAWVRWQERFGPATGSDRPPS